MQIFRSERNLRASRAVRPRGMDLHADANGVPIHNSTLCAQATPVGKCELHEDVGRMTKTRFGRDPALYLRHIIDSWGGADVIDGAVFEEYLRCMRKPEVLAAMGAEYRADQLDLEHDRTDRRSGHHIQCPLMALWAQGGLVEEFGDPIAIWRTWAERVSGQAIPGSHFLMEESPQQIAALLIPFLTDGFSHCEPTRARHDEVPRGR